MNVLLGLSCGFHDSSSCLVDLEGQLLYASSEERFTRQKGDSSFPIKSIDQAIIFAKDNDLRISDVIMHENIFNQSALKLSNLVSHPISFFKSSSKLKETHKLLSALITRLKLVKGNLHFSEHHLSHCYASIATAEGKDGLALVLDAIGEKSSGLVANVKNQTISSYEKREIENSLGLIYSAVTVYCGFKVLTGEYKLMGLAPYGKSVYYDALVDVFGNPTESLTSINDLNIYSNRLYSSKLEDALGFPPREKSQILQQKYADLAASVQIYLENAVCNIIDTCIVKYMIEPGSTLYLGGGIALNCKLNLTLSEKYCDFFSEIWAFPASGDTGSSIGACFNFLTDQKYKAKLKLELPIYEHCFLGPDYDKNEIFNRLDSLSIKHIDFHESLSRIASKLADGEVGAIFTGRSEFGPRALGNRSIIGNPTKQQTLSYINSQIKSREDFRPLAPVILQSNFEQYFKINDNIQKMARFMLVLARSLEEICFNSSANPNSTVLPGNSGHSTLSSVVHLDGTARIQIVDDTNYNSIILELLNEFYSLTGVPVLVNTSFNVRGEPIVETIDDAINCFKQTGLSFLILGKLVIFREDQNPLVLLGGTSMVSED